MFWKFLKYFAVDDSRGLVRRSLFNILMDLPSLQVYRQLYAPNPFASETDEDIQKYMKEVEAKTPRSSSAADSTEHTTSSPPLYENDSPSAGTLYFTFISGIC